MTTRLTTKSDRTGARKRMRRKSYFVARSLKRLHRPAKQFLMVLADVVAIPAALVSAIALKYGSFVPALDWQVVTIGVVATITTVPLFVRLGLYRAVIR